MHVRGFTRHPSSGVAEGARGTFAGLIEKIPYLQRLGVTAVELLPVFQFDPQDCPPGRVNYWGYSPVSFFAPHQAYSSRAGSAGAGGRVPRHGQGPAPGGPRGHPRRGVQPHRGGRPPRADPELPRAGQQHLLHPRRGPFALRQLQRHRQHPERQSSHRPPDDRGQSPLLGGGDARGRLPLRSRLDPLPR